MASCSAHSSTLEMEAVHPLETPVNIYQTPQHKVLENNILQIKSNLMISMAMGLYV
jgi:hypothetical protein